MLVLTAPARIRNPTMTTKHSMIILRSGGPGEVLDQAVDEVIAIAAVVALDVMIGVERDELVGFVEVFFAFGVGPAIDAVAPVVGMFGIVLAEVIDFDVVLAG